MSAPTTWQEAARGIEPWDSAKRVEAERVELPEMARHEASFNPDTMRFDGPVTVTKVYRVTYVVDLADPDTRTAFDRRLALRLGAPPEAVDEGVVVSCVRLTNAEDGDGCWEVWAGRTWAVSFTGDDFPIPNDPLLFRALAWRSVP